MESNSHLAKGIRAGDRSVLGMMARATAGQGLSEPQPVPSQHSQRELKAGRLHGRAWPQVLYLISV